MSSQPPEATPAAVIDERSDSTLLITINRPHARNAIDDAVGLGLLDAMARFEADAGLRVAVLTGVGPGFSAGIDLKQYREMGRVAHGLRTVLRTQWSKPVIAAVESFAYGAGLELALATDMVVVAASAMLGLPEVGVGLIAAGGGLTRLLERLPYGDAMHLLLTGESITGEHAYARGLAMRCTADGAARDAALELAARIAAHPADAVATSKRIVRECLGRTERDRWAVQDRHLARFFGSPASRELAGARL